MPKRLQLWLKSKSWNLKSKKSRSNKNAIQERYQNFAGKISQERLLKTEMAWTEALWSCRYWTDNNELQNLNNEQEEIERVCKKVDNLVKLIQNFLAKKQEAEAKSQKEENSTRTDS